MKPTRDLIRNITFISSQRDTHSEFADAIVKLLSTFVGKFFEAILRKQESWMLVPSEVGLFHLAEKITVT